MRYRKKAVEEMRAQIGIEHAPAPKLGFLRRYRTRQLVSALLAAVMAITLMCLLYSSDFKYQNTEAGRLSAVEDFVTQEKTGLSREDELVAVEIGTPLAVHAWAEYDGRLYLFFSADNAERVQGFVELERGINGRYRPLSTTYSPSQRTAGVACINNSDKGIYMLAAYNCRGIYSAELTFHVYYRDLVKTAVMTVGIDSPDFLKIYSAAEFANELGVDTDGMESIAPFGLRDVKLLDESGNDVQHSTPTRASSKTGQAAQAQPRPALFMCSWPSSLYSAPSSCAFSFEETEAYIKRKPVLADGFSHGVGICLSRGEQVIS